MSRATSNLRHALEGALRGALAGEVGFDAYTRSLFSTDASMYASARRSCLAAQGRASRGRRWVTHWCWTFPVT